jgi:DUF1009 family protein
MTDGRAPDGILRPLGILAAEGVLPIEVAEAARARGRPVHIVALTGFAGRDVEAFPHEWVSLGQVGRILGSFRGAGCDEMVIAGAMQRPDLLQLRIDWGFVRHLPTVLALTRGGDDSVLRRVVRFFEGQGLRVVGAGEVAPKLLAAAGPATRRSPTDAEMSWIAAARELVAALGRFDIGQAVVVGPAGVVSVEGVRGTDAMLRDLGRDGLLSGRGRGGVLVKLPKPGQEMRIDLPTIGRETVARAIEAGLVGIAVADGGTIVLDRDGVLDDANQAGIFVYGATMPDSAAAIEASPAASMPHMELVGRRAPTPADRADGAIGRQVVRVLAAHQAGIAALVEREHVLAVFDRQTLSQRLAAHLPSRGWGRRRLGARLGVLVVDCGTESPEALLDADLFRAAMTAGLAGVVVSAPIAAGEARGQVTAWADEAGVFLMCPKVDA